MLCRTWCDICVRSKNRIGQRRRHLQHHGSIWTMPACMIPIPTVHIDNSQFSPWWRAQQGCVARIYAPRRALQHGLSTTSRGLSSRMALPTQTLQFDNEPASTELISAAAQQLGLPVRQAPIYEHSTSSISTSVGKRCQLYSSQHNHWFSAASASKFCVCG